MTDGELHVELRRRHPTTASALADITGISRTEIDQGLRRLAKSGRAERIGTVTVGSRREYAGEDVYEARPLR